MTGASATSTPANSATTVPQTEINTLGNILASCVNSPGPTTPPATPTACNTLFSNATNGATAPTDTATAAINVAHNPGANVAALFALAPSTPPFLPALSTQPHDFTIAVNYFAVNGVLGNLIAIDAFGNIWCLGSGIAELTPSGAPAPGSPFTGNGGSLLGPIVATFDPSGNLWIANTNSAGAGTGSLSEFTATGTAVAGSPFVGNGLDNPVAIAADASGSVWLSNFNSGSVSAFTSNGSPLPGSPFTGIGLTAPARIAIQPATGNVWVTDAASSNVAKLTSAGVPVIGSPFGVGSSKPYSIAVDSSSNIWIGNYDYTLSELNAGGVPAAGSPFTVTSGIDPTHELPPYGMAIDGAGNVWMAGGYNQNYITKNTNTGAQAVGSPYYSGLSVINPTNLDIDGSGNIWVSNALGLTEFIGAAVPTVIPLSVAVKNNTVGTRP